jgi:hypothetical protein
MTGGVGHSRQRRGLDKGAGSEALTGDGRRGGQSSGGVAVPSSSRCSCARRRVRVGEGAAAAVNRAAHCLPEPTDAGNAANPPASAAQPPATAVSGTTTTTTPV